MAEKVADFYGALGMRVDAASFAKANKFIGQIKGAIAAFVGFKITQGIVGAFESIAEGADNASKVGAKLGITAEAVQELGHAAGLSGVEAGALESALGKLARNLDEVATQGKGPAADALRRLKISASELKGESLDQNLEVIANRFAAMPDGIAKTSLAMDLFGKSGKDLIPLLNEGEAGIVKLRQEARDLGIVVEGESAKAFEKFNDDAARVSAGWKGFKTQAALAVLPLLQELLPGLISAMKSLAAWARDNKLVIAAVFHAIGEVVKFVIRFVVRLVEVIVAAVKAIVKAIVSIGKWWIRVARDFRDAVASAFNWVVERVRDAWNFMISVGQKIVDTFIAVGEGIKEAFRAAFDWVVNKAKQVGNALRNLPVIKQLGDFGEFLSDKIGGDRADFIMQKNAFETARDAGLTLPDETEAEFDARRRANIQRQQQAPSAPPPPPATGPVSIINDITVNPSPGMDEVALGEHVGKAVDDRMSAVFRHVAVGTGVA